MDANSPQTVAVQLVATHLTAMDQVMDLGRVFNEAGFELAIVGGSVRDLLSGDDIDPAAFDFDLTTDARPDDIKRVLKGEDPIRAHEQVRYDLMTRAEKAAAAAKRPAARKAASGRRR